MKNINFHLKNKNHHIIFQKINKIKKQRKTYDESVNYFKVNDPDFIESIIGRT